MTEMTIINLSSKQLRKAAKIQDKIADLQNELSRLLGSKSTSSASVKGRKKRTRRPMSAAAKKKIAAAAKARWKKAKAAGRTSL